MIYAFKPLWNNLHRLMEIYTLMHTADADPAGSCITNLSKTCERAL